MQKSEASNIFPISTSMVSLMTVLPPCVRRGCTRLADSSLRGCRLVHVIATHTLSAEHSSVGARSHICDISVSKGEGSVHNIHMCAECCWELDAMLSTRVYMRIEGIVFGTHPLGQLAEDGGQGIRVPGGIFSPGCFQKPCIRACMPLGPVL